MTELVVGVLARQEGSMVSLKWARAFRKLLLPKESEIYYPSDMPYDVARNYVVQKALDKDARFLFFLDSDVMPPPEIYYALSRWRLPIISALYYTKKRRVEDKSGELKTTPAMWRLKPDGGLSPIIGWNADLIPVDASGMGACLIDVRVFQKISNPWFEWKHDPLIQKGLSEDLTFCLKVRREGLPIYVNTAWPCEHVTLGKAKKDRRSKLGEIVNMED